MNKPASHDAHAASKPKLYAISPDQDADADAATGVTMLKDSYLDVLMKLPLPGLVIFVHGVNSDGEWYDQTEEGLCAGLNDRLKRRDEQMVCPGPVGGQLTAAKYTAELTADGYLNPERKADNFLQDDEHFSPVIRFRWGYKASGEELQNYGDSVYLNEKNYWGGGPFANGCTALPDLWNYGLSANLFLWLQVQHLNPDNGRQVYSCPHRSYYVIAALRLAKLVAAIREQQADVPITIVCHSQGNMIGMAAAFLGDRMGPRAVADSYVLCNPPYSLVSSNFTENWTQTHMTDKKGGTGRQSRQARIDTLRAFFDIIRSPASVRQEAADINRRMANKNHQFDATKDRQDYGYGTPKHTCGRVTLYCNPHDQVISSSAIRGIGWLGLNAQEVKDTGGEGVFSQRVFAQDFEVGGRARSYHYWTNHYRKPDPGSGDFWFPESPKARYSIANGVEAGNTYGTVLTVGLSPLFILGIWLSRTRINALPPSAWEIPLDAPKLPASFLPKSNSACQPTDSFDEGRSAPGQERDPNRQRDPNDPYAGDHPVAQRKGEPTRDATDAGKGTPESEARLRYEDHGRLRMQARREGLAEKGEPVVDEDDPTKQREKYKKWRSKKIKANLLANIDANATDHSTIMTNPMHAEKALAYDVAVGLCNLSTEQLRKLRISSDWRLLEGNGDENETALLGRYFITGKITGKAVPLWVKNSADAHMPNSIVDIRENARRSLPPETNQ